MFSGKISYRFVKTDSANDVTILVTDTQANNLDKRNDGNTSILEESTTNIKEHRDENVSALIV